MAVTNCGYFGYEEHPKEIFVYKLEEDGRY